MNQSLIEKVSNSDSNLMQRFMSKVYLLMAFCLLISTSVAYYISSSPYLAHAIVGSEGLFIGLLVVQLACVFLFRTVMRKCGVAATLGLLLFYSFLTGTTLFVVTIVYTSQSIVQTLAISTASFVGLSVVGFVTKRDLTAIGSFCSMGLIGLIILSVASFFLPGLRGNAIQLAMAAVGVLIFSGFTAYDTQKIKKLYNPESSNDTQVKLVLSGALMLYLDFINLFLQLLRLLGRRR